MHERNHIKETHNLRPGVYDWLLESFVGQMVYLALRKRVHFYPEERKDWKVPEKYLLTKDQPKEKQNSAVTNPQGQQDGNGHGDNGEEGLDRDDTRRSTGSDDSVIGDDRPADIEQGNGGKKEAALKAEKAALKAEQQGRNQRSGDGENGQQEGGQEGEDGQEDQMPSEDDPNIVTWYGPKDPANPQNWSVLKKSFVTFELCLLTFSIYIGSAIYSPGYQSLNQSFGVSSVAATLGLTLFVVGYGTGPLFLAPLSEIPAIGRSPPYVITLALFVALQPITATVQNFGGLLVLRFLAGFIGSPVLATGGASLGDMFSPKTRPYAIGIWGLAAVQGPVLGPLLGGFAIQAKNWRWAFWILLWLDGFCLVVLLFFFPETSSANILLRRAERLRKRTGNQNLRSQGEIMASQMTGKDIAKQTLLLPIWLSISEPICFFLNLYIGLVYAILYVWIESFSLVFVDIYGFNLGENGLAYLGLFVGAIIAYAGFCIYNAKVQIPQIRQYEGKLPPEKRLPIAMFGAFWLPLCLFSFGATSLPGVPWIVPIICSSFFSIGTFLLFQSVLNYLQDAYPEKAASVLAGNDFFRSMMGAGFPLFARAMFTNLGFHVFWGCVLLGCLTILFVPIPFVLYKYGKKLRLRSKNARHDL